MLVTQIDGTERRSCGFGSCSQSVSLNLSVRRQQSLGVGVLDGLLKKSLRDCRMLSRDLLRRRFKRTKSGSGGTRDLVELSLGDQLSVILCGRLFAIVDPLPISPDRDRSCSEVKRVPCIGSWDGDSDWTLPCEGLLLIELRSASVTKFVDY